jgi:hypothetical protein
MANPSKKPNLPALSLGRSTRRQSSLKISLPETIPANIEPEVWRLGYARKTHLSHIY